MKRWMLLAPLTALALWLGSFIFQATPVALAQGGLQYCPGDGQYYQPNRMQHCPGNGGSGGYNYNQGNGRQAPGGYGYDYADILCPANGLYYTRQNYPGNGYCSGQGPSYGVNPWFNPYNGMGRVPWVTQNWQFKGSFGPWAQRYYFYPPY